MNTNLSGQSNNILDSLISSNYKKLLPVIENIEKYELQILYTKINRQKDNSVSFETCSFNEQPSVYFYPASTVKLPAAILALEKLNDLNVEAVNKDTHISIDSVFQDHVVLQKEYRNECGKPNLANYIKQIFLVSDNESFNRLYDFLGQKEINERLLKRGFANTNIIHRLSVARTAQQNRESNSINFFSENGKLLYTQPARIQASTISLNQTGTLKGNGYYTNGKLIDKPMDFSENNIFGLRDQHNLMLRIMFPENFTEEERFNLTKDDYRFLRKFMSMLPKESKCPNYDSSKYYDGYLKFLMFGDTKENIPDHIQIYNKSGLAYGYLTDNAYIVDKKNNIEFILSAAIHVNENGIYNDDNYEYDEIGLPFLANLGKIIYDYQRKGK